NNEDDQVTKKNSLTMARELDKSRAEVANAEKPNPETTPAIKSNLMVKLDQPSSDHVPQW
ncbi:hypothetical protein Tco_1027360, partial [Tanacetum coccineum]